MRILQLSCCCVVYVALATPSQAAVDGHFDQTFPVSAHVQVDVLTESGDISVRTGEAGKLEIHATIHGDEGSNDSDLDRRVRAIEASPPIVRQEDGSTVQIGHFSNPRLAQGISISYEIVVPVDARVRSETSSGGQTIEGIRGPLDANSGSGNLQISHITGDTHASTGSGDINLRDIRGSVYARAGTGTVRASTINRSTSSSNRKKVAVSLADNPGEKITFVLTDGNSPKLEIITGSGDVEVEDLAGSLEVTTGSGAIQVAGDPTADWRLDTGSGTVRLLVPESANFALAAHTSSGTIETHGSIALRGDLSPRELRGQVGKGGPTVDLKTGSGNIEIE